MLVFDKKKWPKGILLLLFDHFILTTTILLPVGEAEQTLLHARVNKRIVINDLMSTLTLLGNALYIYVCLCNTLGSAHLVPNGSRVKFVNQSFGY